MKNYNVKLNLTKLNNAYTSVVNTPSGNKMCVIIPVEENNIFLSQKGSAYLNMVAQETREVKFDQTHQIKVTIPADKYRQMTQQEREQTPIIGGLAPMVYKSNTNQNSQPTNTPPKSDIDSLPF